MNEIKGINQKSEQDSVVCIPINDVKSCYSKREIKVATKEKPQLIQI